MIWDCEIENPTPISEGTPMDCLKKGVKKAHVQPHFLK